jgi:hypothetical protein
MGAKGGGWVGVEGLNAHTSMIQKYGLPVLGGGPLDTVAGWGGSGAASLVWGVPPHLCKELACFHADRAWASLYADDST